jgi:hypothetical protein
MRLLRHLNENEDWQSQIDEMIKKIKSDCKFYLKLIGDREPVFRGIKGKRPQGEIDVRQNRMPVHPRGKDMLSITMVKNGRTYDTQEPYWVVLNQWLKSNGHAERNKSVSVSSDFSSANAFGNPYWVFPKGKFKYSHVRSEDFNYSNNQVGWNPNDMKYFLEHWYSNDPNKEPWGSFSKDKFDENIISNDFKEGYERKYEMWFQCKSYYHVGCSSSTDMSRESAVYFAKEMGFYDDAQKGSYPLVGYTGRYPEPGKKEPISNNDSIMTNLAKQMERQRQADILKRAKAGEDMT